MGSMATYRIRVKGYLDDRWADYFGCAVADSAHTDEVQPSTTWIYESVDQADLFGTLRRMNGLGLEFLLVEYVGE